MTTNSTIRLADYLPQVYHPFLPELFSRFIPQETRSTCDDCVMCVDVSLAPQGLNLKSFTPGSKCCTYHPSLPNYLVGALLASSEDSLSEGRRRMREKIANGVGVTPRGVVMPRKYALLYENGGDFFGRSETMRCPYLQDGNCTIWKYREAVCTTYFCKHLKGPEGKAFWEELKRYLNLLESKLSLLCLSEIETNKDRLAKLWEQWQETPRLGVEEIDGCPVSTARHQELWDAWTGKEEAFYIDCHRLVETLTADRVMQTLGIEETFLRKKLEIALNGAVSDEIPTKLRRNPELCVVKAAGNYLCTSPVNRSDVFELSSLIYPLLEAFDGEKAWVKTCETLALENKLQIPKALVAKLYYLGALVA